MEVQTRTVRAKIGLNLRFESLHRVRDEICVIQQESYESSDLQAMAVPVVPCGHRGCECTLEFKPCHFTQPVLDGNPFARGKRGTRQIIGDEQRLKFGIIDRGPSRMVSLC